MMRPSPPIPHQAVSRRAQPRVTRMALGDVVVLAFSHGRCSSDGGFDVRLLI
jgi:hypothetical protein